MAGSLTSEGDLAGSAGPWQAARVSTGAEVLRLDSDDPRWGGWVERCRHDFHHLPRYAALEATRMGGTAVAYAFVEGDDVALLPLVLRAVPGHPDWLDGVSPYGYSGPVFSRQDAALAARAIAAMGHRMREHGLCAAYVRTHMLLHQPLDAMRALGRVVAHAPTAWIDLTRTEAEQWADYRAVHRNLVRRASRAGLEASMDPDWVRFEEFYEVYAQTMEDLGARWSGFARDYLQGLRRALGPAVSLCLVDHQGQVAAGGVFTECDGIVQYHFSGTASAKRSLSPSRLMIDHVRRWAAGRGHRALHLGGGVGGRDDALFRFKRGFSRARAMVHTWQVVPDRARYDALVAEWERRSGRAAAEVSDFFPVYRRGVEA